MIPFYILAIEDDDDREFMTHIYHQYQRLIYQTTYQVTKDTWAAEDVMQETFLRLIDKIPLLRSQTRDRQVNYIITAATHTAYNYLRKHKNVVIFTFDENMDTPLSLAPDPIEDYLEQQSIQDDWDSLRRAWPKLDRRSQYLLEGTYILEKSAEEIAKDLGIKASSTRMALTRAKRKARELISEEMQEGSKAPLI